MILKASLPSSKTQRLHLFEYTLYAIILLVALGIPFFVGAFSFFGWKRVLNDWVRLLPFVLIFATNNYILVPKLLFREKIPYYILTCILSIIGFVFLSALLIELTHHKPPPFEGMNGKMPPPSFFIFTTTIIAILLIGFNTGVKSFIRWSEEKLLQSEKERQHLHTELAFLKHQISPHFFMNTLNNIHALVDINTQDAKNAIIKLSHLMRYLLYESDIENGLLKKEIDFIESYIELMRLRYDDDNLTIETEYPDNIENVYVPSSLFLSFIENAFKHGIHPHDHSLITISFSIEKGFLTFQIANRLWKISANQTETTGLGLENVRKRLDLIFKDNYTLDIQTKDNIYKVMLIIPAS